MNTMAAARSRRASGKVIPPEKGISRSYDDIDHSKETYKGEEPKPGLHPAKLVLVEQHTTSEDAVHWKYEITSGPYKGWWGHVYTNSTSTKWKEEQQLVACGLIKEGESVALTFEEILKKAKPVRLRTVLEEYNDEHRAKIKTTLAASTDTAATEDEEADEEDEDFTDTPSATRAKSRRAKASEPEPEDDEEEDEEVADDEARDERAEELEGLVPASLKKILKEDHGLKLADYRGKEQAELIDMILDLEFPSATEDGDEEEGVDLDALEEELSDMDSAQLVAKAKEFGVSLKERRGATDEKLIDLILDKAEELGDKLPF